MASFNWLDFLGFANELEAGRFQTTYDEARLRTTISRAYYSVFGSAIEWLDNRGIPLFVPAYGGMGMHERLWETFRRDPDLAGKSVGQLGQILKRKRIQADYHPIVSNLSDQAELAVLEAIELSDLIGSL
jgi:hypothetical protein